ncbi:hypothetical protein NXX48_24335 [Bacteroides faecis]|nr:hypothetical protein [Bacteroides faecis]MCS2977940.1 hypothetical protein [Bacteroides faecis]
MVESYEDKNGNKVDWTEWHGTTTKEPPYDQLEPRFRSHNYLSWLYMER